jgi:hypothetical protein
LFAAGCVAVEATLSAKLISELQARHLAIARSRFISSAKIRAPQVEQASCIIASLR